MASGGVLLWGDLLAIIGRAVGRLSFWHSCVWAFEPCDSHGFSAVFNIPGPVA